MGFANCFTCCCKRLLVAALVVIFVHSFADAQKEFDGGRGTHKWMRFTDAPNALYHHLADQAFALLDKRDREIAALNSLADWRQRQQFIKMTLLEIVGPFPVKNSLNARITRVTNEDNYTVENIIYESQPGFHVTAYCMPLHLMEPLRMLHLSNLTAHTIRLL